MINPNLLNIIFNKNIYDIDIYSHYIDIIIPEKNINIIIVTNEDYIGYTEPNYSIRKNCVIKKFNETTFIIFNKSFIKSIIRQKIINNIINT